MVWWTVSIGSGIVSGIHTGNATLGTVIAVQTAIGLLVLNMLREKLLEFFRAFIGPKKSTSQAGSEEKRPVSAKTFRGRPAFEGRSRSVPQ